MTKKKLKWSIATQGASVIFCTVALGWISLNLFMYFSFQSWHEISAGLLAVAMLMMWSLFVPEMVWELRHDIWRYRQCR